MDHDVARDVQRFRVDGLSGRSHDFKGNHAVMGTGKRKAHLEPPCGPMGVEADGADMDGVPGDKAHRLPDPTLGAVPTHLAVGHLGEVVAVFPVVAIGQEAFDLEEVVLLQKV
ncbi:MAG TPA: hypothetical protein VF586_09155, partial [Pyrinomonadaceae bacterium]